LHRFFTVNEQVERLLHTLSRNGGRLSISGVIGQGLLVTIVSPSWLH
jgi:hypothetical protein